MFAHLLINLRVTQQDALFRVALLLNVKGSPDVISGKKLQQVRNTFGQTGITWYLGFPEKRT